jgi:hypothetical protein
MRLTFPEVRTRGVPGWLVAFLGPVRRALLQLVCGVPERRGRAVTFHDLVALGLVSPQAAQKQAEAACKSKDAPNTP